MVRRKKAGVKIKKLLPSLCEFSDVFLARGLIIIEVFSIIN